MEELLKKDIVRESDLLRYGPDYISSDIYLRLQLRRDMMKDSHKNKPLTRNQPKRKFNKNCFNNSYKVNNEIAKINSFFRNKDAKNKLISKKNKKHVKWNNNKLEADSPCSDSSQDKLELKILRQEMDSFLQSSQEISDLKIENENEYKLLPRLQQKSWIDKRNSNKKKVRETSKEQDRKKQETTDAVSLKPVSDEIKEDFNCNFKHNDLQSLLVMMTISSDYNEQEIFEDNCSSYNEFDFYPDTINKHTSETSTFVTVEAAGISEILKVSSIKKENSEDRQLYIAQKYVEKWKMYVKMKTENVVKHRRKETVNKFLDKLTKAKNIETGVTEPAQKAKMLVRDYNSYHHRYKVQKHIIALQKAKLEQQNKIIEELKYNKIIEASRQSLDCTKDNVRKAYYEIDKHLKPKIKCLTNELNIKDIEEPSLILHCLKVPQFLQRMETRAREREEKHAIIRERRKQMEEERIRLKQQAELVKAEMDKEEKINRIKELKEKRKREKIENIRKKQYAERIRALVVMADLHYERSLMLKYGLRPFQRLIQIKCENIEKAKAHHKFQLMKNIFLHWMFYTEDTWLERNYIAEENYRKKLLRKTFNAFKQNHYNYILKKQVAEDYYDLYITQLVFRKFREGIKVIKQEFEIKWNKAINYYECNLLFKTFTCWRTLPALNALKREQEARKLKWRQKVLQVVPDYKPPDE